LDNATRIGGPDEGPGVLVGLGEVTIDGSLQFGDRAERAASEALRRRVSLEKNVSTAFSQEPEVGVKWKL
jgi:hypothetical protein